MKNTRTDPAVKQSAFVRPYSVFAEHRSFKAPPHEMLRPPTPFLSQFVGVSA